MSCREAKESIAGKVGRLDATYLEGKRVHSGLAWLSVSQEILRVWEERGWGVGVEVVEERGGSSSEITVFKRCKTYSG